MPELLRGDGPVLEATPGEHVGVAWAGDLPIPFAYWVPAGYDPRRPEGANPFVGGGVGKTT